MASRSMTSAAALPTSSAALTSRSTTPISGSASTISNRGGVAADPVAVVVKEPVREVDLPVVHFRMYSNYASFLKRAEIRIFDQQSLQAAPLVVIPVDDSGLAEWQPATEILKGPARELKYLLRAYDPKGNYDET